MTKVLFHFLTSEGAPIAYARVEIRLTRSDYEEEVSGVLMARLIEVETGLDGKVLQELMPCNTRYHVTVYDTITDAALHYHFYVPVVNNPDDVVQLQDIIVDDDVILSDVAYDAATLLQMLTYKNLTIVAKDQAEAAALAAEAAAQFSDGVIEAAEAARDLAAASAVTAVAARDTTIIEANDAADSALLAEDRAAAALVSKNAAAVSAADALTQAGISIAQAAAALQSAVDADASEAVAIAARDTAVASAATSVAARDITTAARDVTTAARDVTLTARDVAVDKAAQLSSQLFAFNEIYLGKFAVAPTVDGNGGVLKVGAIYENTVEGKIYQWESDLAWHPYDEESQAQLNSAILSASNAAASAGAALASQSAAATSATDAAADRATAVTAATNSATSAAASLASENAAELAETNAETASGTATTKAAEAAQSAADAAASAALALEAQIQVDWTQTNNTVKDYIKNKPVLAPVATSGAKADVGLGNVDNTSDASKPVSTATQTALDLKQTASAKDASGGYAGLTALKLNLKNVAGTFISFLTNTATAARTWTMPDKDGTVAMTSDITGTNSGVNTGDETQAGILTKLGASQLTGSNTGDETNATILSKLSIPSISGTNTGDETLASIKSKLGITTLSGSNTGDQTAASLGLGNVTNTSDANKPVSTAQQAALDLKANITYVDAQVAALVDASPSTLNTLNELAAALGDDANFATTMTNSLAGKLPLAGGTLTGTLNTRVPSHVAAISSLNGANVPIYIGASPVATGAPSYTPFIHHTSTLTGYGYNQHISIGSYRPGDVAWGGGVYMAVGGSDNNATEAFYFTYGGGVSHSSGVVTVQGNITGNAVTANYATSAASAPLLSASGNYAYAHATLPTTWPLGETNVFVQASDGWFDYGTVITTRSYSGGGGTLQMYTPYSPNFGGSSLKFRMGNYDVSSGNSWTAWHTILDSLNFNSYAPSLTGVNASGTWGINVSGTATYALNSTRLYATGGNNGTGSGYGYADATPYYLSMIYATATNRWRLQANPATPANVEVYYSDFSGTASAAPWAGVTGKPTTMGGYGIADFITSNTSNPLTTGGDNMAINGLYYVNGMSILGQTDGAIYGQAYSGTAYQHQIFGDYRTGQIAVRGRNNTTWQAWRTVWDSGNLAAPSVAASVGSLVQRDASGYIMGSYINMTDDGVGSGAAAVTAIITKRGDNYYRATQPQYIKNFLAYAGSEIVTTPDTMAYDITCSSMMRWKNYGNSHVIFDASAGTAPNGAAVNNTTPANPWTGTYPTLMGWNGSSSYGVRVDVCRLADNATTTWVTTDDSYATEVYLTLNRGGGIYAAPYNSSKLSFIASTGVLKANGGYAGVVQRGSYGSISIRGTTTGYAGIDFTDASGTLMSNGTVTGWFYNNASWSVQWSNGGDFTATGNVTAYSDERLKENWRDAPADFIARWAGVKSGTYDRTDKKATQVGASAQDIQAILPDAVQIVQHTELEDCLALNYGGAALVATVELAKKAVEQAALIEKLLKRIEALENK